LIELPTILAQAIDLFWHPKCKKPDTEIRLIFGLVDFPAALISAA
jgi:hypothetical protein